MADVKVAHNLATKPRTVDVSIDESVDFASLHLSDSVLQGLKSSGFHRPSPIQLKAIPLGRCGLDLIVQAKSGTGKTCVFSVVALECVNVESNSVQAIVVAPTREIAVQIWEVINLLGSGIEALRCYTFIGGMPLEADKKKLKRCHIAVGTPGRLKQLLEEGLMWPDSVRLFVLDEADKLLEDSFQDTINWIYSCLPENKQMLALSATYPEALAQHLTAYMRAPTFVRLNASDPALLGIRQYYKTVAFHPMKEFEAKVQETLKLLSAISFNQCLVFSKYQTRAESLSKQLSDRGWPSVHISGQQEQQQRLTAMAKLRQYKCRVLVTTDLTSRGIDAENVNLVIHLDIPRDHETYLHRVGRAGRFGTYGASIAITGEGKELGQLCDIQDKCNTDIIAVPVPIPSDLAKSSGYVNLDHLVSTEQLTPSNALPSESDSAMEARGHIEGRLTREGACAPNSQGQEKVDWKTGCTEGVKEERIKEEVVEEMNKNEEKTEDNSNQEQEEEALPKDSKDEALYIPPKPQKLQFQYPERTVRKPISLTEISDFVTNAKDVDRPADCLSISTCPSNIETLTEQIADVLDSVHLGKKQAICRMAGEKEVEGLLEAEMLGTRKNVEKIENQKDQKAKKKGRLVKQDLTLGQEYFSKLAPKDDFPETETEDSDSSESETESESGTTSYQESDFTNVKNPQKASGRRRTNSYRRLLSKGERNKQSEGNLYADDEGSETPGVCGVGEVGGESYPKLQWTPVEKSTKQEVVNLPIREHYNDQYDGESRRLGDEGEDTEEEESDSSDSSSYSDEEDEDDQIQSQQIPPSNAYNQYYPYPPSAYHSHTRPQASGTEYPFHPSHPYSQYYNHPPFPSHATSTRSQSNAGDASSRSHAKNPRSTATATMPYPGMGADSYFGMDPNFGTGSNPGTNPNFGTGADSYFRMDPNFSTNPNFGAGAGAESYYGTDAYSVPRYPDPYLQNSTTTSAAAVDPEPVPPPPWSGAYERHVYTRYRQHRHRADYYAALYRHAVNTRMMEDVYRRQEGYIKSMAKAASGQGRR